jgi:peptidoglycan/LPS O-acetylase OafA/YrhL
MSRAHPSPTNAEVLPYRGDLPGLHGLRALAACAIILLHTLHAPSPWMPVPAALLPIVPDLSAGVMLFFILSAFSLLYSNQRIIGTPGWIRLYLLKRVFRIAPLFYAMLAIYCARYLYYRVPLDLWEVLANLTFIFNAVPGWDPSIVWAGWTVGVEMPFYLCVPLIMLFVRTRRQAWGLLALSVAVSISARALLARAYGSADPFPEFALASNLVMFAFGVALFHTLRPERPGRRSSLILAILSLGGLGVLAAGVAAPLAGLGRLDLLLFAVPLTCLCAWQATAPSRWLKSGVMQWLGERSYSLYLLHPFVIYLLMQVGAYNLIVVRVGPAFGEWYFVVAGALTIVVTAACSAVSYRLVERPGQVLGAWLGRRWVAPALVANSAGLIAADFRVRR